MDPARRAGWCAWGILAVALLTVPFACAVRDVQAQEAVPDAVQFTPSACRELGDLMYRAAEARAIDARLELFLDRLARRIDRDALPQVRELILREARRAWLSGLDGNRLREDMIVRCLAGPFPLGEEI